MRRGRAAGAIVGGLASHDRATEVVPIGFAVLAGPDGRALPRRPAAGGRRVTRGIWIVRRKAAYQGLGDADLARLGAAFAMTRGSVAALRILRRRRATIVVSVGGYASVPAVLAALLAGRRAGAESGDD